MSFWDTDDGETITKDTVSNKYEDSGQDPIPEKTVLVAALSEFAWKEWDGIESIGGRFDVLDGKYKGRIVWYTAKVFDKKTNARKRALRMLATIDMISGGVLLMNEDRPTDVQLAKCCNKPMEIRVGIYNGKNYVDAIGAIGTLSGSSKPVTAPAKDTKKEDFDDDIPF